MKRVKQSLALGLVIAFFSLIFQGQSQAPSPNDLDVNDYRKTLIRMVGAVQDARARQPVDESLFSDIGHSKDPLYIAPLLDTAFFFRGSSVEDSILFALETITGRPANNGWQDFFEWASGENIALPPHYDEFKGLLFTSMVDPEFARFFPIGVGDTAKVNLLEAVWGGVRVDGIPSLINAKQITPEEAQQEGERLNQFCNEDDCSYPAKDELVFGVSIDGDTRAYPLRLLNWHEMFNDVLGHSALFTEPRSDANTVCNFRAPTAFKAISISEDQAWVQIVGESAGCPEAGWLAAEDLSWFAENWNNVKASLPIFGQAEALSEDDGLRGQVKGKPVMLAYCTLCGAGVLYDTTLAELSYTNLQGEQINLGETVLEFGSSGLLMRSNKLMYDRNTDTVWNALTGVPAFGPLASTDLKLERLPVVVTDWETWLKEHPDTSVLSLNTGFRRDYTNGGAYRDYFDNPDFVMFPVWQQDTSQQGNKEVVFALELDGISKAYPLSSLVKEPVVNDRLAEQDIVIVSRATPERDFFEPGGAAVRAYQGGEKTFTMGEDGNLIDQSGQVWEVTEDALRSDTEVLPRLPGHLAFWFGWYSFNPDTLVYGSE